MLRPILYQADQN